MRRLARVTLAAALFVLPYAAQAAPLHWTASGTSAVIEPSTIANAGFANGGLSYLSSSTATSSVQAYWNVSNPTGSETPAWTTLEVGYSRPANSNVQIILWEVDPCTGHRTSLCNWVSVAGAKQICTTCTFPASTFNFSTNIYVVEATLTRTTSFLTDPTVFTLRIY
jgi:hypothetical protein